MKIASLILAGLLIAPQSPSVPGQQQLSPHDGDGAVGSTGAEFVLNGLDGESIAFPDRTSGDGALTVLVFWATWSTFSDREIRRLTELAPKWAPHGIRIIAVNVESSRTTEKEIETVRAWVAERDLPFPVAIDPDLGVFHAYGVVAVPTTFVLDSSGIIVFRLPGYPVAGAEQLIAEIEDQVVQKSELSESGAVPLTRERRRAVRHLRLGRFLATRDEFELAEYTLSQAIEEDPDLLDARLALVSLYEGRSKFAEAGRVLDSAMLRIPDDARLLTASARICLGTDDVNAAEERARRAFELNPSLGAALLLLARVHARNGRPEESLKLLLQAAEINPLDVEARLSLGRHYEAIGDKAMAYERYEQVYQLLDSGWNP